MAQPGIGAMLHYLGGGSKHSASEYYDRYIVKAEFRKEGGQGIDSGSAQYSADCIRLEFADGTKIELWDNGQSCCESRYMTCDDDVQSLVGHTLKRIEAKNATETQDGEWGDVHEQVFIEIGTDAGFITVCTHNQHNGYYGGFGLTITEPKSEAA